MARMLQEEGYGALFLHGDMPQAGQCLVSCSICSTADSRKLEHACSRISARVPAFFTLGLKDGFMSQLFGLG